MFKSLSTNLTGHKLAVEASRMAAQASGAAFVHYGDTVMLSMVAASSKPRGGTDFLPFSMEYEEKLYSVGKIPGGFNRRGGKASEDAVLTCRIIDRSMRPLFPEDYRNDAILDNIVMCVDPDCSPELTAMLSSVTTTSISNIPFAGPCATTQAGLVGGQFIVSPTADQEQVSDMILTVVSTREKAIMIETGANEVLEQIMIDTIFKTHEVNQEIVRFIDTVVTECGKEEYSYESCAMPERLFAAIRETVTPQEIEKAVFTDNERTREKSIVKITVKLERVFAGSEEWLVALGKAVYQYRKGTVCKMVLKGHKRPNGRVITEIRHLTTKVNLLPRVRGSGVFIRSQTQIPSVCTLALLSEAQRLDGLGENEAGKRYIHHCNFPPFSVDETEPSRGPGRCGMDSRILMERALVPALPSAEGSPCATRAVSGTMEFNGSTSQVSICASTLSLMATSVPIKKMVADISCGLAVGDMDDDYLVFTDTQDLEDFFGDVDFRVGGTKNGITAIQMDIKTHGLTWPTIEEAIARTRETRAYILDSVMGPIISEPRKHLDPYVPKIKQVTIDPQKIGNVVGKQGKVISKIIGRTGVKTDTMDDGSVGVCGTDGTMIDRATQIITGIITDTEAGTVLNGKVVCIMNSSTFVEPAPNKDGMIHISRLSDKRAGKVEDIANIGDKVTVKVIGVDKMGRISLTMRLSDLTESKTVAGAEEK